MRGHCTATPPPRLTPEAIADVTSPVPWRTPRCVVIVDEHSFLTDGVHVWFAGSAAALELDNDHSA